MKQILDVQRHKIYIFRDYHIQSTKKKPIALNFYEQTILWSPFHQLFLNLSRLRMCLNSHFLLRFCNHRYIMLAWKHVMRFVNWFHFGQHSCISSVVGCQLACRKWPMDWLACCHHFRGKLRKNRCCPDGVPVNQVAVLHVYDASDLGALASFHWHRSRASVDYYIILWGTQFRGIIDVI